MLFLRIKNVRNQLAKIVSPGKPKPARAGMLPSLVLALTP